MGHLIDTAMWIWLPFGIAAPLIAIIGIPVFIVCQISLMKDGGVPAPSKKKYRVIRNITAAIILFTLIPLAYFYIDCKIQGCTIY